MTLFYDRAKISGKARITPEGYFVADALVARANNIQAYRASELGLTDRDANEIVRVFRPESEVFKTDSLQSASRLPITLDHPVAAGAPVMVDANNWREFAKGETGEEILRDGEFLRVPIRVTDAAAVTSVQRDRQEFSLGYTASIELKDGTYEGQAYDAIATNLRYNHLAACRVARGGSELRITDERPAPVRQPEGIKMSTLVLIDGLPIDAANPEAAATAIRNLVTARDTALASLADSQKLVADHANTIAARDAQIVTLKDEAESNKLSPAALRDAAAAYARTVGKAKALGVTVTDEMDEPAVKAAAVRLKMADASANYTPEQFSAAFDALVAPAGTNTDPLRQVLQDGKPSNVIADAQALADAAAAARRDRFANSYKNETATAS